MTHNSRNAGKAGVTNMVTLTARQRSLRDAWLRRIAISPETAAYYILNHTTLEEQEDTLFDLVDTESKESR